MSEKKKVNLYTRSIISLGVYLFLFAWLNEFQFHGFSDKEAVISFSLIQTILVFTYIYIGLLIHLASIKAVKLKTGLALSAGYVVIAGLTSALSAILWPSILAGILGLLTALYSVTINFWLKKMKAEETDFKNIIFHLILCTSLLLVLMDAQSYSNILFMAISFHWLYVILCNLIYGLLAKHISPLHSIALLICKQNYSYRGIFLLSISFSILLALVPRHILSSHDAAEAFEVAHSWYFNLLIFISIISVVLLTAHSVSSDFVNKNIFTIFSKPISQTRYLGGKLLGVSLVTLPFLLYFSILFLLVVNLVIRVLPSTEENQNLGSLFKVSEYINPDYLNNEEFQLAVDQSMKADGFEDGSEKYREKYIKKQIEAYKFIPYLEKRAYHFELPDRVKGNYTHPVSLVFEPKFKGAEHAATLKMKLWVNDMLLREDDKEVLSYSTNKQVRIPINEFLDTNTESVKVEILNLSGISRYTGKRMTVYMGQYGGQGIELGIEDRSYLANCVKLIVLMLVQLCFAATLALFAASLLDFSVAILFAACLILIAYGHDFINDAVEYDTGLDRSGTVLQSLEFRWRIIMNSYTQSGLLAAFKSVTANGLDLLLEIVPSFKSFRTIADFAGGVYIDLMLFLRLTFVLGFIWSPLHFLLSNLSMRKREAARLVI